MITEIEKTFFDTFGIEPKLVESCTKPRHKCSERFVKDCSECPRAWRKYPQITDSILLELIKMLIDYEKCLHLYKDIGGSMKEQILRKSIKNFEIRPFYVDQVRTLFEEGQCLKN